MKGIIKLFPVALAVVALASCSNDEFENTGTDFSNVKNGMVVTLENSDVTRAGVAKLDKVRSIVWELKDTMRLYDPEKLAYDWYVMDDANSVGKEEAVFTPKGSKVTPVVDESIVLFPNNQVYAYSNGDKPDETRVTMSIPSKFNYAQFAAEVAAGETTGAHSVLPLWGPVKNYVEADKRVDVRMYYLTAALELDLNVIPASTDLIKITTNHPATATAGVTPTAGTSEPLTGLFDAVLTKNASGKYDEASSFNVVQLKKNSGFTNGCEIDIEIPYGSIARYGNAKFYVPIIAQEYTSILIQAYDEDNHTTATWAKELKAKDGKITAKRGQYLATSGEFQATTAVNSWEAIGLALSRYTSDVELKCTGNLTSDANDYTLEIPENMADKNVTLILEGVIDNSAKTVAVKGTAKSLTIVLNSDDATKHSFDFETTNTDVTLQGKYGTITTKKAAFGAAKTLTLEGTASAATTVATVTSNEGKVTVNGDYATVTTLTMSADNAADVTITNTAVQTTPVGTLTINKGNKVIVTGVARELNANGTEKTAPKTATITTLTVAAKEASIELSDAVITKLNNDFNDDAKKATTVTATGISTIGEVTATTVADKAKAQAATKITSTWDGLSKVASASGDIYTAAQLAKLLDAPITANQTLYADIDLDDKDWTGIAANAELTFAGNGHKISNIALKNSSKTQDGLGFFKTVATGKLTVNNLTLEGVKAQFTSYATTGDKEFNVTNIGGLVGKATAEVAATDVTVSLAGDYFGYAVASKSRAAGIGGLIGSSAAATLNGVTVTGKAINGYYNLGGLIGTASGAVVVAKAAGTSCLPVATADKKSSVDIKAFNVTFDSKADVATGEEPADADMNYGKIALGVGSLTGGVDATIAKTEATAVTALNVVGTNVASLLKITDTTGGTVKVYSFNRGQQWIGFSGYAASGYNNTVPTAAKAWGTVKVLTDAAWTVPALGKAPEAADDLYLYYFTR